MLIEVVVSKHKACYMIVSSMPHPLASHLAPIIDLDVDALRSIVAEWVVNESSEEERARYRRFGAELRALKARVEARPEPPTEEDIEIALTALLAIAGRSRSAVAQTAKG